MQIVVPAAGYGRRFKEKGYVDPKPLIPVLGKPLIKWSTDGILGVSHLTYYILVLQEHIDMFHIDRTLKILYPGATIIPVPTVTDGAACTVLLAKEYVDNDDEMAIVNCDNLFCIDMSEAKRSLRHDTAAMIFYFASCHERWSYVQKDQDDNATRVAEKDVISDSATVGCYYFRKARYFIESAEFMIDHNMRTKGEFYVSPVYNILLSQGKRVQTFPCEFHFGLGTPEEVERFETLFAPIGHTIRMAA